MDYKRLSQDSSDDILNHKKSSKLDVFISYTRRWGNSVLFLIQILLISVYLSLIAFNTGALSTSSTAKQYGRNYNYMSIEHQFDPLWMDSAIMKAGTIIVKEHGGRHNDVEFGAISMFHQLHCLAKIREALQAGHEGRLVPTDWHLDRHWPHCLDYLRQTILCHADGQIEQEQLFNGTDIFIDGTVDTRQCGDSSGLYALFEERGQS
ncbi:hypothetical protein BGW36DRAFT_422006 [Talaromyces proteolyticus]|uniref:Oxidase ustYa n=1 Tax=Talaromyces proteolyticus TaxID=1131652 RepID=A0AAD4L2L4_9EURO|nr:uncharacterized protein BGW36DRAFT_422006 [Talaromyces proteolyticus]KAH8705450.1 hypothetical protein BGW36DRAFT_422006 [Talaromyces proteolyticus]